MARFKFTDIVVVDNGTDPVFLILILKEFGIKTSDYRFYRYLSFNHNEIDVLTVRHVDQFGELLSDYKK